MRWVVVVWCVMAAWGHEGGKKDKRPTKAKADLERSRRLMQGVKKGLEKKGRYGCCVRPGCDLCVRVNGSCGCAKNLAAGKGVCGECYGGWQAGRGVGKRSGVVEMLTAEHQGCAKPAVADGEDARIERELEEALGALLGAKKTLVSEGRFACCVKGGCGQCAHEGNCPCGKDLVAGKGGVCGDCVDRWKAGEGLFGEIGIGEVRLAPMEGMGMEGMSVGNGVYGSGTGLTPREGVFDMVMGRWKGWDVMGSGQLFGVYTAQSGERGKEKVFATNWVMGMGSRRWGPGRLTVRSMVSLEAATITQRRYPLLFATGETANGIPILNGQHPHSFVMELGASYQVKLGEETTVMVYGGPRGEPALGPVAFPHRASASENPVAVIGHHLQDSTHVATNVVTAGLAHKWVMVEVSGFHGREPGEDRWSLDGGGINSLAGRVSVTPSRRWTGQFSMGRLNQREAVHPLRPALRTTASVMYAREMERGRLAVTGVWGRNHDLEYTQQPNTGLLLGRLRAPVALYGMGAGRVFAPQHIVTVPTRVPGQIYNSYLVEGTWRRGRNWVWGRAENVDKDSLLLYREEAFVLLAEERRYGRVQAYTAGYEREVPVGLGWLKTGVGGQWMVYGVPGSLAGIYGKRPMGVQMFVRMRLGREDGR